jgi:hypothetical protein
MGRPEDGDGDGGFLTRWSRRKREARQALAAEPAAGDSDMAPAAPSDAEVGPAAKAVPAEPLPLPSLDDIAAGKDVTAFLQAHVPEALRTAALRKLWVTDPMIRDFIEMADYQWDFTNPDSIPGWSSSIGGVDVKAMAERIFDPKTLEKIAAENMGIAAGPAQAPAAVDRAAEPGPDDGRAPQPETIEISAGSDALDPGLRSTDETDAAMQKIHPESVAYQPFRKRHGGALPT